MDHMSRIETLVTDMTLDEKLGQLTMTAAGYAVTGPVIAGDSTDAIKAGTIGNLLNLYGAGHVHELQRLAVEESRLGIPLLIAFDVIHGHRTLFPVPLGEAALFDPEAWALSARESSREAAADGIALAFAPMLDVSRDPRWGRTVEGPGEDPWLAAQIARAKVRGIQGTDLAADDALAACAKHYCGYGAVTAGRDYASVDISERSLLELHLPPFAAAIAAGVAAVMPAFTDLAGIPLTAHVGLLRDLLRGQLGFDGVVVSDYNAIAELMCHGVAANLTDAATLALKAGVDIDMMSNAYRLGLPPALQSGAVTMAQIDAAVRRVLTLKQRLGLFDKPYGRGGVADGVADRAARRQLARSIGARAIVMLKNDKAALPLAASHRRLAVVGPLADAASEMGGPWSLAGDRAAQVSVVAGLRTALPACEILHPPGGAFQSDDVASGASALDLCAASDAIVLCLGEAADMSGEAACRACVDLPGQQRAFAQAIFDRARTLRKPVIAVLFSGRPLIVPWLLEQADAVLAAWFLGCEAGNAIADILCGRVSPSGRTPMTWPRAVGQIPIFFGQRPGGRPADPNIHYTSKYLDVPNEPMFPFGHGLTYGRFTLSNLRVTPHDARLGDTIEVRVDVANNGARTAQETVFLFTHDRIASVARPVLELKGFGKIDLRPGESGTVTLHLPASALQFLGLDLRPVFEPGEVEILVGPCANRAQLLVQSIQLSASRDAVVAGASTPGSQ
jgi:beta-glucosidase